MIGLDTTAVIDLYRGNEKIKELIDRLEDNFAINQIVYLELMHGLDFKNDKHKSEEDYYDELIKSLIFYGLNIVSCKKSSQIEWELKKIGKVIEIFDCTIAAIYLTNGINKIITRNVKHFENIKDIEVLKY